MAKAKLIKRTIHLALNTAEASTLIAIMDRIGGDRERSRRGHADAIASTLRKVGCTDLLNGSDSNPNYDSIYFKDTI